MARMFPSSLSEKTRRERKRSAEIPLFDGFEASLPKTCRVFYSVKWLARSQDYGAADGEADFVIVHPSKGFLIVEVKGGRISVSPNGTWKSTDRNGKCFEIADPIDQARRSKSALVGKLKSMPGWEHWIRAGYAVAFPHCAVSQGLLKRPDFAREIVLFETDLDQLESWTNKAFKYWSSQQEGDRALTPSQLDQVEQLFAPPIDLRRPLAADLRESEEAIFRLTQDQYRVLDQTRQIRRAGVRGGAGTGKTLLAMEKARRLAEEGFETLLTCYNRGLASFMNTSYGLVPGPLRICTFHGLCESFAGKARLLPQMPDHPDQGFWDNLLPELFLSALNALPADRFDAIVVDEGQDFLENWWLPLQLALRDPENGPMYVFYDDNQRIYRRASTFLKGLVPLVLQENLRNTQQIFHALTPFYSGGEYKTRGPQGPEVRFVHLTPAYRLERELSRLLHAMISEGHLKQEDVGILTGRSLNPRGRLRSRLIGIKQVGAFELTEGYGGSPSTILVDSVRRFKGLEKPAIILVELEEALEDEPLLYVALSRARSYLAVIGTEVVCSAIQSRPQRAASKSGS